MITHEVKSINQVTNFERTFGFAVEQLTDRDREGIVWVMDTCFDGVNEDDVLRDLQEKHVAILLRDIELPDDPIVGVSTLKNYSIYVGGRNERIIFSGDTAVLPEARTSPGIGIEILNYFLRVGEAYPDEIPWWILISKGPDTAKIPHSFFKKYFPHTDLQTPEREQAIIDSFGREYCARCEDLRIEERQVQVNGGGSRKVSVIVHEGLNCEVQSLPDGSEDLDVDSLRSSKRFGGLIRFFEEGNLGWPDGDEMIFIAPAQRDNFTRLANRLIN